jgi:hypothetical protein
VNVRLRFEVQNFKRGDRARTIGRIAVAAHRSGPATADRCVPSRAEDRLPPGAPLATAVRLSLAPGGPARRRAIARTLESMPSDNFR